MPEKERNPKLEFLTNVPQTVKLVKNFTQGTDKYGNGWFAWEVDVEGKPFTMFTDETLQSLITSHKIGTPLTIALNEIKEDGKKPHKEWSVKPAIFENTGAPATPGKASPLDDKEALDSVRKDRKNLLWVCLEDSLEVVKLFNDEALPPAYRLDHQDVRAIAISLAIDFSRRYGK